LSNAGNREAAANRGRLCFGYSFGDANESDLPPGNPRQSQRYASYMTESAMLGCFHTQRKGIRIQTMQCTIIEFRNRAIAFALIYLSLGLLISIAIFAIDFFQGNQLPESWQEYVAAPFIAASGIAFFHLIFWLIDRIRGAAKSDQK
jgi:hypothetical protein